MFTIIAINSLEGEFGVYGGGQTGPFGTPLQFRGTLAECMEWRRNAR